jgi:hypothetical protein
MNPVTKRIASASGLLLLAFGVLVLWAGCASSDGGSSAAATAAGSGAAYTSAAMRQSERTTNNSEKVDPGYLRYLVRMAERRQQRGLPLPPELRMAERRGGRNSSVLDLLKEVETILVGSPNPETTHIPYQDRNAKDQTTTSAFGKPTPTKSPTSIAFKP